MSPLLRRIAPMNSPGCRFSHRLTSVHQDREHDDDDQFDPERDEQCDDHAGVTPRLGSHGDRGVVGE